MNHSQSVHINKNEASLKEYGPSDSFAHGYLSAKTARCVHHHTNTVINSKRYLCHSTKLL
jgi:hypothetical protein